MQIMKMRKCGFCQHPHYGRARTHQQCLFFKFCPQDSRFYESVPLDFPPFRDNLTGREIELSA